MSTIDPKNLEGMIRKILAEIITENSTPQGDTGGVRAFRTADIKTEPFPFEIGAAQSRVSLKDMVTLEESPRLGFGVMEMDGTKFPWTLNYDEVDYVIEGTLEIIINGQKVVGHTGDTIFIPKGSSIEFSAPSFARFIYVVYPANWADQ